MNTNTIGIVAEYNPFHKGHKYQFELIKSKYNAEYIVCVMSGAFVQRGEPAIFSVETRTKMALRSGADVVIELPVAYSLREADEFAFGAISILNDLKCVDGISFGCENTNIDEVKKIADFIVKNSKEYNYYLKKNISIGCSFAKAQAITVEKLTGISISNDYSQPNNLLAISYLKALSKTDSEMFILPIKRKGDYNTEKLDNIFPSASSMRNAIIRGDIASLLSAVPDESKQLIKECLKNGMYKRNDILDNILLYKLRSTTKEKLMLVPGVNEGLENRILKAAFSSSSISEILQKVKTKRYTYSRLKRILAYVMIDVTRDMLASIEKPTYTRLLGFKQRALPLIKEMNIGDIKIISRTSDYNEHSLSVKLDKRAYDILDLSMGSKTRSFYSMSMITDSNLYND